MNLSWLLARSSHAARKNTGDAVAVSNRHIFNDLLSSIMRFVNVLFILLAAQALLLASADCQETGNSWTISSFDLAASAKYDRAINNGQDLYNQGRYDEAIDSYDEAIRLDPNASVTWQAWSGKGNSLYKLGLYDRAILAYDRAIQLRPENALVWAYRGDALKALGRSNESETAYSRANELGFSGSTWYPAIDPAARPVNASIDDAPSNDESYNDEYSNDESSNDESSNGASASGESASDTSAARESGIMPGGISHILDHSMASEVDETSNNVITRTYDFTASDSRAYSWLELANVEAGQVYWYWYSPDRNLYETGHVDIPANPAGGSWPSYLVWYYIDIADIPAEPYTSGNWHVDVHIIGQSYTTQLTEQFSLQTALKESGTSQDASSVNRVLDHCMASSIDETSDIPITRTDRFVTGTDSKIYSWLSLGDVGPCSVYWYWLAPDGREYRSGPVVIPANPDGGYWPVYKIWHSIDIDDLNLDRLNPNALTDECRVDVVLNDRLILTENFAVD